MKIEGTWYVVATNFPMWTKGDRTNPRFIYGAERGGRFDDTVEYEQGGRTKRILGVDTLEAPNKFVWRGKGWLRFFTSRWEILSVSADEQLVALSFTKTLFTPAGLDIISRGAEVRADAYDAIHSAIGSPELLRLSLNPHPDPLPKGEGVR
jgi:hypothetical protein